MDCCPNKLTAHSHNAYRFGRMAQRRKMTRIVCKSEICVNWKKDFVDLPDSSSAPGSSREDKAT